jgi:hypothetical protein
VTVRDCRSGRNATTGEDLTMDRTSKPHLPRAGDIVIYEQRRSAGRCVVSLFQHASHLTAHTHDDAIRDATAMAVSNHVNAWYTADGQRYQSVATNRDESEPAHAAA